MQPVAPAKTNVPSPPTLFLHSTILANVCNSIFQELNGLVQARNNLIHEDNYEKLWTRLKDRVEFVLSELQRSCFDAQELALAKLQEDPFVFGSKKYHSIKHSSQRAQSGLANQA